MAITLLILNHKVVRVFFGQPQYQYKIDSLKLEKIKEPDGVTQIL